MLTIIALVVAVLFLAAPWSFLLVAVAALVDIGELGAFVWWSRRRRRRGPPEVGVEALVGRRGTALARLTPGIPEAVGQVRVGGEIWGARTAVAIERGSSIVVRRVDGLVLEVDPVWPG
ncbi:MAG: NfeD family protein [Thermoleophilia bacterium]